MMVMLKMGIRPMKVLNKVIKLKPTTILPQCMYFAQIFL